MNHNGNVFFALLSVGLVAGCGGGGGGNDTPPTFADLEAARQALQATYASDIARTDVPTAGTATYDGYVGGGLDDSRGLNGELTLIADFAASTVTGTATNFVDSNEQAFTGMLDFTGGVAFGGTTTDLDTLDGFLEGDLSGDGTTYDTSILLDGAEFYRGIGAETPDAIEGNASGLLDDGSTSILLNGGFIVEKR